MEGKESKPAATENTQEFVPDDTHLECLMQEMSKYVNILYREASEQSLGMKVRRNNCANLINNKKRKLLTS